MSLPDPRDVPLLRVVDVIAPRGPLPLGRSAAYAAVERGELPVVRFGTHIWVVNARLQELLGLLPAETSDPTG